MLRIVFQKKPSLDSPGSQQRWMAFYSWDCVSCSRPNRRFAVSSAVATAGMEAQLELKFSFVQQGPLRSCQTSGTLPVIHTSGRLRCPFADLHAHMREYRPRVATAGKSLGRTGSALRPQQTHSRILMHQKSRASERRHGERTPRRARPEATRTRWVLTDRRLVRADIGP